MYTGIGGHWAVSHLLALSTCPMYHCIVHHRPIRGPWGTGPGCTRGWGRGTRTKSRWTMIMSGSTPRAAADYVAPLQVGVWVWVEGGGVGPGIPISDRCEGVQHSAKYEKGFPSLHSATPTAMQMCVYL